MTIATIFRTNDGRHFAGINAGADLDHVYLAVPVKLVAGNVKRVVNPGAPRLVRRAYTTVVNAHDYAFNEFTA